MMEREIKFRGKRKDNGEWVYGYLSEIETAWNKYPLGMLPTEYKKVIIRTDVVSREETIIDENTVGQYTGLKDKNGKEIYEGDIVICTGGDYEYGHYENTARCLIKWQGNGFDLVDTKQQNCGYGWGFTDYFDTLEIIGNIHENPELLEVK